MTNEFVDINLYVNDEKFVLKTPKSLIHMNRMFPPYDIDMADYKSQDLNITKAGADISRTTQEYADQFNKTILNNDCPYMKSHSDGYSFIGEAFINFVTALVVYDMFPNETSSELVEFANIYRNNKYISDISSSLRMSQYITKTKKSQLTRTKFQRQSATSFKGLIGVLYAENGKEKLPEIMSYVNDCLIPHNKIDFTGTEVKDTLLSVYWVVFFTTFGWVSCYLSIPFM
jgi:hypothetical protein